MSTAIQKPIASLIVNQLFKVYTMVHVWAIAHPRHGLRRGRMVGAKGQCD
jgi:hypothetical protein